jgi:hypothetical protein
MALLGSLSLFQSCITRTPGCLDLDATNFDLDADKACDDCCTYPSLVLSLSQKIEGNNFNASDTFRDINQQPYFIKDIAFMVSDWKLISSDQEMILVDSTLVDCNGTPVYISQDIAVVSHQQFQYNLGTLRQSGNIERVMFKVGVDPLLSCTDEESTTIPAALRSTSPLYDPSTDSYHAIRIIIQRDVLLPDTDTLFVEGCIPMDIPYANGFIRGQNTIIGLTVNYDEWFRLADVTDPQSFIVLLPEVLSTAILKTP